MVGRLAATLSLNSKAFNTGLKAAGTGLDRFRGMLGGVHAKVAGLFAAVAGVGFGALVKQSFDAIDANAKLADRLGITTEGLIGLQHGAGLAGVESAKLEVGLTRLNRVLSDAAGGNKKAQETLAALGLSANDLIDLPLEESLGKIADRLNEVKSPADKMRVAMELFGKSGAPLINFLQVGSAGLADMRKEAERLGITFSRVDAAKVEAANDAVNRLRKVFTGLTNTLAIQLAPAVTVIARYFTEIGARGAKAGASIGNSWLNAGEILARVADLVRDISIGFQKAQVFALRLENAIEDVQAGLFGESPRHKQRVKELEEMYKSLEKEINERLIAPTFLEQTRKLRREIEQQLKGIGGGAGLGGIGGGVGAAGKSPFQPQGPPPLLERGSRELYKFLTPLIQPKPGIVPGWAKNPQTEANQRLKRIEQYMQEIAERGRGDLEVGIA